MPRCAVARNLDDACGSAASKQTQLIEEERPAPPGPAVPAVHADAGDVESRIRAAYDRLCGVPGGWVGLADLRARLADLDRDTVDEALRAMVRQPGVRIIPVANSKALQPRDRAAALRIGDDSPSSRSTDRCA